MQKPRLDRRLRNWVRCLKDPVERELLRIAAKPRFESGTTSLFGAPVEFVDAASFMWMYREIFQREIYRFDCAHPAPLIIDAGANIGLSVIYHKRRLPRARVVAIEADPTVFEVLQGNLRALGLVDIEVHQVALWDEETELAFASQGADAGRVAEGATGGSEDRIYVSTALLSSFLDRPIDLLKIDIEGAELRVLREARQALVNVERIFVEYHSFRRQPQQLAELLELLREAGFRVLIQSVGVPGRPFLPTSTARDMDMQLNIFGMRT